jgi:molybdopterin molybdotransferase
MITPAEADALIRQHVTCLPIESLPLAQCAGAVLRENIYAERDQPPFDRVAMDGIALDSTSWRPERPLRVQGMQAAGQPPLALLGPASSPRGPLAHCIEIMTGASLPAGCDAVVPVEQVQFDSGIASLAPAVRPAPGLNVHRRGSDSRQGDLLLEAGLQLEAPEIAIAASAGMARIRVSAQPRIIVISTGNELVEPGDPIEPHQVRRSNAYGVLASLRRHGYQRVADDHLDDDAPQLRERLRLHLDTHDVLILSGGVSMGKLDLVPQVLAELGVQRVFHKIAQRPGKPMWFGMAADGTAVFALPGNPVSTLVCLARYVLPALRAAMGARETPPERIALAAPVEVKPPLACFMPVRISIDDWGRPWAQPRPTQGSGDFISLAGTDGFVELPPGPNTFPKGFVTSCCRW